VIYDGCERDPARYSQLGEYVTEVVFTVCGEL
jgi:hypothetical protein